MNRKPVFFVAIALGVAACSVDVLDMTGDAMIAVGDALQRPDALARDIPVTCEPNTIERSVTLADGSRTVTVRTEWLADVTDPAIQPYEVTHATSILCDLDTVTEVFPPGAPSCPSGATCETTGEAREPLRCQVGTPQIEAGRARVVCGSDIVTTVFDAGGTTVGRTRQLYRYRNVRLLIE